MMTQFTVIVLTLLLFFAHLFACLPLFFFGFLNLFFSIKIVNYDICSHSYTRTCICIREYGWRCDTRKISLSIIHTHTLALTYILLCSAPLLACSITVEDGGHSSTRYCCGSGKLRCAYTLYYFYCIFKKVCLLIACCFFAKIYFFINFFILVIN